MTAGARPSTSAGWGAKVPLERHPRVEEVLEGGIDKSFPVPRSVALDVMLKFFNSDKLGLCKVGYKDVLEAVVTGVDKWHRPDKEKLLVCQHLDADKDGELDLIEALTLQAVINVEVHTPAGVATWGPKKESELRPSIHGDATPMKRTLDKFLTAMQVRNVLVMKECMERAGKPVSIGFLEMVSTLGGTPLNGDHLEARPTSPASPSHLGSSRRDSSVAGVVASGQPSVSPYDSRWHAEPSPQPHRTLAAPPGHGGSGLDASHSRRLSGVADQTSPKMGHSASKLPTLLSAERGGERTPKTSVVPFATSATADRDTSPITKMAKSSRAKKYAESLSATAEDSMHNILDNASSHIAHAAPRSPERSSSTLPRSSELSKSSPPSPSKRALGGMRSQSSLGGRMTTSASTLSRTSVSPSIGLNGPARDNFEESMAASRLFRGVSPSPPWTGNMQRTELEILHKHKFQGEASNWGPLWGIRDGHITRQHTAFVNRSTPSGTNPWDDLSKCLPEVICGKTYVGRLACNDPASALPNAWETRMPLHPHPDKRLTLENELKKIFVFYASDLPREPRQAEMEAEQNMIDAVRGGFEATVHFFYHVDGSPGGGSQVTSPNAGSKGEATLSRSGLSFRRRKSKIMEKREEDIFDGVVKVLTFKGFIEMLADSDILGGDGMKERFRLGDGAEKVTSLQMTKGLIQALGWKKVVDENFALYIANALGDPSPEIFDTRLTWSNFRDELVPLLGVQVYTKPANNWQGEPRNFDKVSMFSRNILLAKCMRKTPDIPLCYFHQRDVVDSLFKRRFVLQTLFAHYAGLQQYLHDVAHNPGIVSLLQDSKDAYPWGPGNGSLRMSELEFLAIWDNFGMTNQLSTLATRRVRLTKEVLSFIFHSAKNGMDGDQGTPLLNYLEFLDSLLRVALILYPPDDVSSSSIADTPVSIFHPDGAAVHWPSACAMHTEHPVMSHGLYYDITFLGETPPSTQAHMNQVPHQASRHFQGQTSSLVSQTTTQGSATNCWTTVASLGSRPMTTASSSRSFGGLSAPSIRRAGQPGLVKVKVPIDEPQPGLSPSGRSRTVVMLVPWNPINILH